MKAKNIVTLVSIPLIAGVFIYAAFVISTEQLSRESIREVQLAGLKQNGGNYDPYIAWRNFDNIRRGFFNPIYYQSSAPQKPKTKSAYYSEIQKILETNNLDEQVGWYNALIDRVGVEEAQEALYNSGLPFTGQTHLLNHTAGDAVYEQFGAEGLAHCKDYFLQSCYHGAIINIIANDGIDALIDVMETCHEAGKGPITIQCSHGIGHGFVAWYGYKNLPTALEKCDWMGEHAPYFSLFNCYDGVFMENLWGVHDDGTPSPDRWIKKEDPYYPCYAPEIKEKWREGCFADQASVMYQLFDQDLAKVSLWCDKVPEEKYRFGCQNNLARQIHPLVTKGVNQAFALCDQTGPKWRNFCLRTVAMSEYSLGGRELPFDICHLINPNEQEGCYNELLSVMRFYNLNRTDQVRECGRILDPVYQNRCISFMENSDTANSS